MLAARVTYVAEAVAERAGARPPRIAAPRRAG